LSEVLVPFLLEVPFPLEKVPLFARTVVIKKVHGLLFDDDIHKIIKTWSIVEIQMVALAISPM
jgi:hypothetical protein